MHTAANTPVVAIVGGGFCGTMIAVHLLQKSKMPLHIVLINAGYPLSKGIAYSSYSHKHLLNVAAKNMSAFADKPSHFTEWIKKHENYGVIDQTHLPDMFLPRNIYGNYLKDVFENAIRHKPEHVSISFVHDQAIDMEIQDGKVQIYFSVSPTVEAHKVVLATGNEVPGNPLEKHHSISASPNFFANPWLHAAINHLPPDKEVLIIGNGLTMVDIVLGLKEKNHTAKIYSLSPHGFQILPHRKYEPYKELIEELTPPYDLMKVIKLFRWHIKKLRAQGIAGEAAVDSLRPLTQLVWQSWNRQEKERFLYHIRHMWGVARHRLPMNIHQNIQQLILDDKLEIIAGRITDVRENVEDIHVTIKRRRDQNHRELNVARIINCTGPQADINKTQNPIYQNLVSRKLVQGDDLRLGIHATTDGTIIHDDGSESNYLYTIGSPLKSVLWESTAVPELRMQAKNMAEKLIHLFSEQFYSVTPG